MISSHIRRGKQNSSFNSTNNGTHMIDKMELAWIVVTDIHQAVRFYTEVIGLKLQLFIDRDGNKLQLVQTLDGNNT